MLLYVLKLNQNAKMPEAYGKYYAYPVITQTVGIDGLAGHMASHNTPFSKGAIKGMITDMAFCIKELCLQGISVKIDDLAIFSIGIRNKEGAASEKEFTIAKNIDELAALDRKIQLELAPPQEQDTAEKHETKNIR